MCTSSPSITSQLGGRHRLRPGGLAMVIRQVFAPFRARAGSYSQLAWFWLLRRSIFCLCYINVDVLKALEGWKPSLCSIYHPN
jgi:hypothetical protein